MLARDGVYALYSTSDLLRRAVGGIEGQRVAIAFDRIESYLAAAKQQNRRIWRRLRTIETMEPDTTTSLRQIFADIHLYFICWNIIHRMLKIVAHRSGCQCVKPLLKPHGEMLKDYSDARDHLEHYEERLPGGSKRATLSLPADMGNLHGTHFTFGGRRYDISPDSAKRLSRGYSVLNRALRKELIQKLRAKG